MRRKAKLPRQTRARSHRAVVTIHDVAARAGVSVATVSRVLNGKSVVRDETRREVDAAAKALRYVPNIAARSLSIRRSHTIGIVLPDVHGEFFSEVIRGIDLAARKAGYHILVSGSHSDVGEMLAVLEAMRGRVDGLVLMAPDVAPALLPEHLTAGMPLVLLNAADSTHDMVTIDNFGGARAMMKHLAALGHRRIAVICGPARNSDARERLRGYRHAMRELGADTLELPGDFTEEAGYTATLQILAASPRPTAIFAANDAMAVGALAALVESGVAVPEQIAVTGFDDIPIARYVAPSLTTMRVDIAELGGRAFALLHAALGRTSPRGRRRRERLDTTLIIRKSCGGQLQQTKPSKQREAGSARPPRNLRGQRKGEMS
jgi:LacI family transcriptional regulator